MKRTKEEIKEWNDWLETLPKDVREVAEKFPPFKKFKMIQEPDDIGNYYSPVIYDEHPGGTVTLTCYKTNEEMPFLGGYNVFGISPKDLKS